MIDTHAHLDALDDVGAALGRARAAGVTRVVAVGTGVDSWRATLALCERHEDVFAALGVHPHEAGGATEGDLAELRRLLAHPKAVAVGETGLDYYRDLAPRDRQSDLFRAQVALAAELGMPVVVHTRAADADTVGILEAVPAGLPVILHCFSSTSLVEPALAHGWYASFAGNVTYPKAAELRRSAVRVPRGRLLAETDSPFLSPQPVRGKPNEPAHVVHTLTALAAARGEEPGELERAIDENASAAFGLP